MAQVDAFLGYLKLLMHWNLRINLTSICEPERIVRLHFLDSLAIFHSIDREGRMMDMGSGAGFPGIPIKIIYPEKEVYLFEARRKRSSFLHEVKRKLNLQGLGICTSRVETIEPTKTGPFDEAVTRATLKIHDFLRLSGPFLRLGGKALMMAGPKGIRDYDDQKVKDEASVLGFHSSQIITYNLPLGSEKRSLLTYMKEG